MKRELLPLELISYIFSFGCDDSNASVAYLRAITSVSSFWRHVAISTPGLWCTIAYDPSPGRQLWLPKGKRETMESMTHRICERLKIFLARSCAAPIDVSIRIFQHNAKQTRRIRDIIIPHLWRCHSLSIWYDDNAALFPLAGHMVGRLKKLTSYASVGLGPITLFTKDATPPLRSLTLGPCSFPLLMDFVPANTLTHLKLQLPKYNATFVLFLRQCNMVERLELISWPASELLPDKFTPVSMPSLKYLYISDTLALEFQDFLFTPNLVELYLHDCLGRCPETSNRAPTMLAIETVTCYAVSLEYIQRHIMPFSSVKTLVLKECDWVSNFLRCLAGFPEEGIRETIECPGSRRCRILPCLEYLQIDNYYTVSNRRHDVDRWLKVVLENKPSLRVAVSPDWADYATGFEA